MFSKGNGYLVMINKVAGFVEQGDVREGVALSNYIVDVMSFLGGVSHCW